MLRLGCLLIVSSAAFLAAAAGCSDDKKSGAASCTADACAPCSGEGCAPAEGGASGDGAATDGSAPPIVCPMAKVNAPALTEGGSFGTSIAIDGTLAAVGAPSADAPGGSKGTGTVFLFSREGCEWTHRGATTAEASTRYDEFGGSVAIAGGHLLVGAPRVKEFTASGTTVTTLYAVGAAYLAPVSATAPPAGNAFQKLGGINRDSLYFGAAVALSPDAKTALGGAPGYGYNSGISEVTDMGAVWLMTADGAAYTTKDILYGPDKDGSAGTAIAFGAGFVLSGAPAFEMGAGTVHVYTNADGGAAWPRAGAFRPQAPVVGSRFGATIALAGNVAVVGAPYHREGEAGAAETGAAYVFVRGSDGSWSEAQKLAPSDGAEKDHFGQAIALSTDFLVIGAPNEPFGKTKAGAVYVFEKKGDAFVQKAKLLSPETAAGDAFGAALAISSGVVLAGAASAANGTGALFTFTP